MDRALQPMIFNFTEGQLNPPASMDILEGLSTSLSVTLPEDYVDFLRQFDGGEGFIGDRYIIVWKADELADFNREYEVEKYAPGILLFGSTGGGEGYGFDTQSPTMPVVRVPFIGMHRRYARPVAENFTALFVTLAGQS